MKQVARQTHEEARARWNTHGGESAASSLQLQGKLRPICRAQLYIHFADNLLGYQEAFFLELRGDEAAMRHYIAAYIALEEMTDTVDAQMIEQVKLEKLQPAREK